MQVLRCTLSRSMCRMPHIVKMYNESVKYPSSIHSPSKPTRWLAYLQLDFVDDTPRDPVLSHPFPHKLISAPARQPLPVYIPIPNTDQRYRHCRQHMQLYHKYRERPLYRNTSKGRIRTQYGKFSYTLKPGAGGTSGASTRKTFERKKAVTTGVQARKGGAHRACDAGLSLKRSGVCR